MTSALTTLAQSLAGLREGVLPSAEIFPRVDVDQVASELRLEARGLEDGAANVPSSDSTTESAAESDARAEIERRAAKSLNEYQVQLDLYEGRIRRGLLGVDL